MIDIIMTTTFGIVMLVSLYIIVNLYRKVDFLEQVVDSTAQTIQTVIQNMKDIDTLGSFEADDETGSIFKDLQNEIESTELSHTLRQYLLNTIEKYPHSLSSLLTKTPEALGVFTKIMQENIQTLESAI